MNSILAMRLFFGTIFCFFAAHLAIALWMGPPQGSALAESNSETSVLLTEETEEADEPEVSLAKLEDEIPDFDWEENLTPLGQNRPAPERGAFLSVDSLERLQLYVSVLSDRNELQSQKIGILRSRLDRAESDVFLLNQQLENLALGDGSGAIEHENGATISLRFILYALGFALIGLGVGIALARAPRRRRLEEDS